MNSSEDDVGEAMSQAYPGDIGREKRFPAREGLWHTADMAPSGDKNGLNVILKSFDGHKCKEIVEASLKGMKIGTCISIMDHTQQMPRIDALDHSWMPAAALRAGQYPGVEWNDLLPIDEPLLEALRDCEATFLRMAERYAVAREEAYGERKEKYLRHVRYWNHVLETKKIDLLLLNHVPHQGYDYVLYCLCKLKGVPTLSIERCVVFNAFYLPADWRDPAPELRAAQERIAKEYPGNVPLAPKYEEYFKAQTERNEAPWFMSMVKKKPAKQSFVSKWGMQTIRGLLRKPKHVTLSLVSPAVWHRKWQQHTVPKEYEKHVRMPDLEKPFIYVPLHLQPEASTCPQAGPFTDQELIVQLLSACVPEGVSLYVKEHPAQGERSRTKEFYDAIAATRGVTCVPRTFSTFDLTKHSLAVATATGTAGLEALFRGKPVLMFGHRFFQEAPGVHRIRTREDCKRALEEIFVGKGLPDRRGMRVFLKAVEETAGQSYVAHLPDPVLTEDQQAEIMGEYIRGKILGTHQPRTAA